MLYKVTNLFHKEICPYCFEYFRLKDTPFRCTSPPKICPPEPDPVYADKWEDSSPKGKVLVPKQKFKELFIRSMRCHHCHNKSYTRICPHCHMELPQATGHYKNHIFAVIGAKDSGKSHYIAVLIDQIRKRVGPTMRLLLSAENDFTRERYKKDFYDPLFKNAETIRGTISALSDQKVSLPMIYEIRLVKDKPFKKNVVTKYMTIVFFDTAGEDLEKENVMSTVNKYIYRSNGIILLIDPLQLGIVRSRLPKDTPLPGKYTETVDILERTTALIKNGQNLKETEKIKTPLAISFSKFDAVLSLVDPQFQLHRVGNHVGGFDMCDFEAVNSEMMSLLDQWNGQDIIQQAQTRYSRHAFFGLSSLGCNPDETHKVPQVVPKRVEDPFLWLLAENGIIKKKGSI